MRTLLLCQEISVGLGQGVYVTCFSQVRQDCVAPLRQTVAMLAICVCHTKASKPKSKFQISKIHAWTKYRDYLHAFLAFVDVLK